MGETRDEEFPSLHAFLAAVRPQVLDAEAEARAVEAFRAARERGALAAARTRRRDDWRPRERRWSGRPLRTTFAAVFACATLGGVAVAAIGSASDDGPKARTAPSSTAPDAPATATPGGTPSRTRPPTAQDTEAHCQAYEQLKGRGKALDSTAWQRLVREAGGASNVAAYCAEQLADTSGKAAKPDGTSSPNGRSDNANSGGGTGNQGSTDRPTPEPDKSRKK